MPIEWSAYGERVTNSLEHARNRVRTKEVIKTRADMNTRTLVYEKNIHGDIHTRTSTRRYVQKALRRGANARRCVQCSYEKLMKCKHEEHRSKYASTSIQRAICPCTASCIFRRRFTCVEMRRGLVRGQAMRMGAIGFIGEAGDGKREAAHNTNGKWRGGDRTQHRRGRARWGTGDGKLGAGHGKINGVNFATRETGHEA